MGIYVCMYTWKTRRLSHVCANLVIRPPPGWCLVARPRPPANSDHAREISFGRPRRKRSTRARICSMDRSRHVFRGTESGKGKERDKWQGVIWNYYWIVIFVSRVVIRCLRMWMHDRRHGFQWTAGIKANKSAPFSRVRSTRNVLKKCYAMKRVKFEFDSLYET